MKCKCCKGLILDFMKIQLTAKQISPASCHKNGWTTSLNRCPSAGQAVCQVTQLFWEFFSRVEP